MKKYMCFMMGMLLVFPLTMQITFAEDKNTDITYDAPVTIYLEDDGKTYVYSVSYGETIQEPSHASKKGYHFLGWYVKDTDTKWDFQTAITEEIRLEARYEKTKEDSKSSDSKSSSSPTNTTSSSGYQLISTDVTGGTTREYGFGIGTTIITSGLCIYVMTRKKRDEDE